MSISSRPSTHSPSAPSLDSVSLSRALNALSAKLLTPTPSSALRHSSYERTKTAANLEYARTLLLRLEQAASKERIQSRKQAQQAKLAEQRGVVKQLTDRLFELGQQDKGTATSGVPAAQTSAVAVSPAAREEKEVDPLILALLGAATADKKTPSIEVHEIDANDEKAALSKSYNGAARDEQVPSSPPPPYTSTDRSSAPTATATTTATTDSNLRSRRALLGPQATTTGSSSGSSFPQSSKPSSSTTAQQKQLESADSTHAALTSSLLSLASALKESAAQFQDDLAADTEALKRSELALGKNVDGLDAATAKMGVLSKMSEGRWWWGRMVLYAGIAALWVFCVLLVFVGPKIRF